MKYWVGIDIYFESISLPYMPLFLPLKARRTQRFKGFLGALCGVGGLWGKVNLLPKSVGGFIVEGNSGMAIPQAAWFFPVPLDLSEVCVKKEISNDLMYIFNSANFQFITLAEISRLLQRRGIYERDVDLWEYLCTHYLFCDIDVNGETKWGLKSWLPPKERRKIKQRNAAVMPQNTVTPLHIGEEIQRTISVGGFEIKDGTLPLHGQDFNNFTASMDMQQRKDSIIELRYYGSENFTCRIAYSNSGYWSLKNIGLTKWYKENGVQPSDKIWLVVESIKPLALRIYTEWDRDADTYRRYEQRRNLNTLPYVDLSIRDIIYLYLKRTQQISHSQRAKR